MRLLMVALPAAGHLLPMIPFAWAARAAGHEVLFGSSSEGVASCVQAGLAACELAPGVDVMAALRGARPGGAGPRQAASGPQAVPPDVRRAVVARFTGMNEQMAEGLLRAARHWQPDAVVYGPTAQVGRVVAEYLGVPAVLHGLGITFGRLGLMNSGIAGGLAPLRERLGLSLAPAGRVTLLDTGPPSMDVPPEMLAAMAPAIEGEAVRASAPVPDVRRWPMRYVPYNGGKALPDWLLAPPARPRVCITLGSALPSMSGIDGVREVLAALARLDVEVVLALGEVDLTPLGTLPTGVHVAGWMPLSSLAPTCTVIVHHGGSGTTMNALVAGVPQLVLPHFADQPMNAASVAARGVGLRLEPAAATADAIAQAVGRLLGEASFRQAAREVKLEIASLPTPADRVARLADELAP